MINKIRKFLNQALNRAPHPQRQNEGPEEPEEVGYSSEYQPEIESPDQGRAEISLREEESPELAPAPAGVGAFFRFWTRGPGLVLASASVFTVVLLTTDLGRWGNARFHDFLNYITDQNPEQVRRERWRYFRQLVLARSLPPGGLVHKGRLYHRIGKKPDYRVLARDYLPWSDYYTARRLEKALRAERVRWLKPTPAGLNNPVRILPIPGSKKRVGRALSDPLSDSALLARQRSDARLPVRGYYVSGGPAGGEEIFSQIERVKKTGANAIVYDIKDVVGTVQYPSRHTEAAGLQNHPKHGYRAPIRDLKKLNSLLRSERVRSVARFSLFQDILLAGIRDDYALKMKDGSKFLDRGRPIWLDGGKPGPRRYMWELVHEIALSGVDEVQFDYVRYPTEGKVSQAAYHNVSHYTHKVAHIRDFLKVAQSILRVHNVLTSIDVFGIVAWGETRDIMSTGQDLDQLSHYTDIISPMVYPSHFNHGFHGFKNPADEPYHFIFQGCQKVKEIVGNRAVVRPWLQAFSWRVTNYNAAYIKRQIAGARDGGARGWLMWNASNKYGMVDEALAGQKKDPKKVALSSKPEA